KQRAELGATLVRYQHSPIWQALENQCVSMRCSIMSKRTAGYECPARGQVPPAAECAHSSCPPCHWAWGAWGRDQDITMALAAPAANRRAVLARGGRTGGYNDPSGLCLG